MSNRELASNQSDGWLARYHPSSALADEGSTYEWFSSKDVKDYQDNTALEDMYRTSSGVGPAGLYDIYFAFYRLAVVPAFSF
ncbi:hypothetical protein [Bifidobacterium catenulatum]|uniref:hypothetical protein n=1 Tax=Bifidobacterium TaxID=1678 RepID=UPI0012ABABE3|nr:hypothetical protein [Bifidobacterium catenulatum]